MGIHTVETPGKLVRTVYIVYNSLDGNGPPTFIAWEAGGRTIWNGVSVPEGCADKIYVSKEHSGALVAIPHCLVFPQKENQPDTFPPGKTRDASQMVVHRIPGLSEVFLYLEDDISPSGPFDEEMWYDAATGKLRAASSRRQWIGQTPIGEWEQAKQHSIDLLQKRYGARPDFLPRRMEGRHYPIMVNKCLMYEIEELWPADFAYTVGKAGITSKGELIPDWGAGSLQFITLSQAYGVDRGAMLDRGGIPPVQMLELHTNGRPWVEDTDTERLEEELCNAAFGGGNKFINVQGPGWSSDFLEGGRFLPRADFRRMLHGYFKTILPQPSRWESSSAAHAAPAPESRAAFSRRNCARFEVRATYPWWLFVLLCAPILAAANWRGASMFDLLLNHCILNRELA
jgi:hypothetical protein